MELNQDWRGLQRTFYPAKKDTGSEPSAVYLVHDRGVILTAFSEGESLSDWTGMTVEEFRGQFPHRVLVVTECSRIESWVQTSLAEPNLPAQVERVRSHWAHETEADSRNQVLKALPSRSHFLIDALERSWWSRVLPSSFALLLRLESDSREHRHFILVYRKGKLEHFGEPDLTFMSPERRESLGDVTRYLAERLALPVQGVQLLEQDWKNWSDQAHPWKEVAWAIQSKRVQLVPFRWQCVGLVATRGLIGL